MKVEDVEKIFKDVKTDYNEKNRIYRGLEIVAKYVDEVIIHPEHDQLYFNDIDEISGLPEEEITMLAKLGFFIDSDFDCLSIWC